MYELTMKIQHGKASGSQSTKRELTRSNSANRKPVRAIQRGIILVRSPRLAVDIMNTAAMRSEKIFKRWALISLPNL